MEYKKKDEERRRQENEARRKREEKEAEARHRNQAHDSPMRSSMKSISINPSLMNDVYSEPATSRNIRHNVEAQNRNDETPASKPSVQHL